MPARARTERHWTIPSPATSWRVCGAIVVLALVGAALQERNKARRVPPPDCTAWQGRTSGLPTLAGGLVVWLAASWMHLPLAGWPAGVWRWLT